MKTTTQPRPLTTAAKAALINELRCYADRINEAWHACHLEKSAGQSTFYYRDLMKFADDFEKNSSDANFVRD